MTTLSPETPETTSAGATRIPAQADPGRRALVIVDVQPTFCEGGALPVPGGNAVAEAIAAFVAAHRGAYDLLITTQDWHVHPGSHFATPPAEPDYVHTWPPHGLAGTPEAELHPALADVNADVTIKKGAYSAAYSGFEGVDPDGLPLADVLEGDGIEAVDIVGIAESHCVKQTALDAAVAGLRTRVLTDLTVPVTPEQGETARREMAAAGVELIASSSAV